METTPDHAPHIACGCGGHATAILRQTTLSNFGQPTTKMVPIGGASFYYECDDCKQVYIVRDGSSPEPYR